MELVRPQMCSPTRDAGQLRSSPLHNHEPYVPSTRERPAKGNRAIQSSETSSCAKRIPSLAIDVMPLDLNEVCFEATLLSSISSKYSNESLLGATRTTHQHKTSMRAAIRSELCG